jgi:hypothetical protein
MKMSKSKRSKDHESRRKPLDLWQAPDGAGVPLICLTTTFTFDAQFFEVECLGRFLQMDTHPSETEAVGYLIEREEKLASVRACVFADRRHAQSKESLRWDVLPVVVPRAAQHAKISILCWADCVRVIIASGNLTEPGYRKNLEVFGCLEARREETGQVMEILSCVDFFERLTALALGDETRHGPKQRVRDTLSDLRTHVRSWPQDSERGVRAVPLFSGVGDSVFSQLRDAWPSGSPPRAAKVLSPFFDEASNSPEMISGLASVIAKRKPREIDFYLPAEDLPEGKTRVLAPLALMRAAHDLGDVKAFEVSPEQGGEIRPLHAKMFSLSNDEWHIYLIGSSNFTRAGFGLNNKAANLEANLAYLVRKRDAESNALEQVWPEVGRELDVNDDRLLWEPTFEEEGEGETSVALPRSFREALYDAGSKPQRLILLLGDGLPKRWQIKVPDGDEIINSDSWQGGAEEFVIAWEDKPVPFVLNVQWQGSGAEYTADWPVNVAELAHLPPPEELRNLKLEELIEILSSTRPLHVAAAHVLRKRAKHTPADIQLDPHKRVNTETFLLRRTKRVAIALERLRQRLERPVMNVEALDWRLCGPVGAAAIAAAFRREAATEEESLFFLAELALTLSRVRVQEAARGGLSPRQIEERLRASVSDVEELASPLFGATDSAVGRYARDAFRKANS